MQSNSKEQSNGSPLAVVVGGAHGIGEATCRLMVARGWRVVVVDKDAEAANALGKELGAEARTLDVTQLDEIEALAVDVNANIGPVDALVVSSGAFQATLAPEDIPQAVWDRVLAVNLTGTFRVNTAFGTRMVARGRGSIVNIASVTGSTGAPTHAYAPSKAAVINMSVNLACEWGHAGVRVNSVSPGVTLVKRILDRWAAGGGTRATGNAPEDHATLGRCVEPSEIAEGIVFLASDMASAITGIDLPIDAGWKAASGWEMYGGPRRAPAADPKEAGNG